MVLLLLAMLLRGIVAPGYMPGGAHGFVVLCPEGLPQQVLAALFDHPDSVSPSSVGQGHHHHAAPDPREAHANGDDWSLEHCALGQAVSEVPTTAEPPSLPPAPEFLAAFWLRPAAANTATRPGYHARAPPLGTVLI